jgi:hypothetical protein
MKNHIGQYGRSAFDAGGRSNQEHQGMSIRDRSAKESLIFAVYTGQYPTVEAAAQGFGFNRQAAAGCHEAWVP